MRHRHHTKELTQEIVNKLDAAYAAWKTAKESKPLRINVIIDAYVAYANLVREYIDCMWV